MEYDDIIERLRKRLRSRQLQAAKYGIGADPVIEIECEDLIRAIRFLTYARDNNNLDTEFIGKLVKACRAVGVVLEVDE